MGKTACRVVCSGRVPCSPIRGRAGRGVGSFVCGLGRWWLVHRYGAGQVVPAFESGQIGVGVRVGHRRALGGARKQNKWTADRHSQRRWLVRWKQRR